MTTCLFHLWVSPGALSMDRPRAAPVSSESFARGPEGDIHELTCYRRLSPPAGVTGETSRSIKPRVRALRSQLWFCPVFNEASEPPRHAAHAHSTKSNPFRPHESAGKCGELNIVEGRRKARAERAAGGGERGGLPRARVERSACSAVGGGADRDGVGGIRTVDSQPVTRGRAGSPGDPGASAGKQALTRRERYYLRTPRSLLHGQP